MIYGIGIDSVHIKRMHKAIHRYGDLLISKNINLSDLSITDKKDYAFACVVFEKIPA